MSVRELTTEAEFRDAFTVMKELRDHLDVEGFMSLVAEMRPDGYRLLACEDNGTTVALAGIGRGTNLYYGHYLWVYDLITSESARSKGHGLELLTYVEDLARREGCETVALSSGLHRLDAHRFYLDKAGFEKVSYTFKKTL
jgi:GNAT superfamily N-acetyltransferase